jgi:hypothetical protein
MANEQCFPVQWSSYDRTWFSGPDKQEIWILICFPVQPATSSQTVGRAPTLNSLGSSSPVSGVTRYSDVRTAWTGTARTGSRWDANQRYGLCDHLAVLVVGTYNLSLALPWQGLSVESCVYVLLKGANYHNLFQALQHWNQYYLFSQCLVDCFSCIIFMHIFYTFFYNSVSGALCFDSFVFRIISIILSVVKFYFLFLIWYMYLLWVLRSVFVSANVNPLWHRQFENLQYFQ